MANMHTLLGCFVNPCRRNGFRGSRGFRNRVNEWPVCRLLGGASTLRVRHGDGMDCGCLRRFENERSAVCVVVRGQEWFNGELRSFALIGVGVEID